MNLAFTIAGGSNALAYDVFATAALANPDYQRAVGVDGPGLSAARGTC